MPPAEKPRRLAVLETAGWDSASVGAKQQLNECVMRLKSAGVEIRTRHNDDKVAALETDLAQRGGTVASLQRLGDALVLPHHARPRRHQIEPQRHGAGAEIRGFDARRASRRSAKSAARLRAVHAALAANCDACITLAAPSNAPEGLLSTGNPEFAVPASLLGVPALSLPLFEVNAMPLGLQLIGFFDRDADAFAIASWLFGLLQPAR